MLVLRGRREGLIRDYRRGVSEELNVCELWLDSNDY